MRTAPHILLLLSFALLAFTTSIHRAAAQITYFDGDFAGSNWSYHAATSIGSIALASRIASGGNPGAYAQDSLTLVAGSSSAVIWAFNGSAVYDPSTLGAIGSVGYQEDLIQGGAAHAAGSALLQNGLRYWRYCWQTDTATWTTRTATPNVGSAGYSIDGAQNNGTNPVNPDFSSSGAPITFGYFRNATGVIPSTFTTTSGIDNWQTTVFQVPEPSTTAMLAIGIGCLAVAVSPKLRAQSLLGKPSRGHRSDSRIM